MVSADPLGDLNLSPGKLDSSHFWHGGDTSPAGKWSIGSRPSLFLLLEDRLRPVGPALLRLRCKVRLRARCEAGYSVRLLRLRRPRRTESSQSTDSAWSSTPKVSTEVRRPCTSCVFEVAHRSGFQSFEN